MKKTILKKMFCGILVVIMGMQLAGCGSGTEKTSGSGADGSKDTLTIGELWNIDSIDPTSDGTLIKEKCMVTEVLVECDDNFSLTPCLAASWKNIDSLTWEVTLRDDVKFHDGTDMNAEAVKWSIENSIAKNPTLQDMAKISKIEVTGDYQLTFTTTEPVADFIAGLHYSNFGIMAKSSYDDAGNFIKPIGTGAYKLDSFDVTKEEIKLSENDNYWGEKASVKNIIVRAVPDSNVRALSIENGEVDFTCDVPYNEIDRLDKLDNVVVKTYDTPRIYQSILNCNTPFFADKSVRQAVNYAIDRKTISQNVLFGSGTPAAGPYTANMEWCNTDIKGYDYNKDKAVKMLKEAGWEDSDGDGILDKDGQKFEFTILTYDSRPGLPKIAEAIQAQLKDIGISVKVTTMEWNAISEIMKSGGDNSWGMYLSANATTMIPTCTYYMKNNLSFEGSGYDTTELYSILDKADQEFDMKTRYEYSKQAQALLVDDSAVIYICNYGVAYAFSDRVTNFKFNSTAHDYQLNSTIALK